MPSTGKIVLFKIVIITSFLKGCQVSICILSQTQKQYICVRQNQPYVINFSIRVN